MYGVAGERWLPENDVPWLPGYEQSLPVRVGNGAASQMQLDVYGELMDTLHAAREADLSALDEAWTDAEGAVGASGDDLDAARPRNLGSARRAEGISRIRD